MNLKDKVIVVTGASKGIGLELSKKLSEEGADLILISRTKPSEILPNSHYIEADLTTEEGFSQIEETIKTTKVDILCNVAGIGIYKTFDEVTLDEMDHSYKLNVLAPFRLTKILLNQLQSSEIGLVLNIGSGAGTMPFKNRSAYCTTKYALRGLSLSLSEEFGDSKPHFCHITLGSTKTTFGGKSIEEQERKISEGNAIFPVEYVADELVSIIKSGKWEPEIVLYPSEHGFGTWKKP